MFELFSKLSPLAFFIALTLGILYSYLVQPSPVIIVKYPTKEESPVYKDQAGSCYKYTAEDVPCPLDTKEISEIPIQ